MHDLSGKMALSGYRLRATLGFILTIVALCAARPAAAIPSFAQQTGQPCSACHVGAFGPQLKPYGRDFKLYGYQSKDDKNFLPTIAAMVETSVTHTQANQSPPPAPTFGENNNFAVDQASLYFGGRLPFGFGAFVQGTYSGISHSFNLDNTDVRRAFELDIFGRDSIVGLDFNNTPTVQDVWNSTPAWGFPYDSSALAPTGAASTLLDGQLGGLVAGATAYVLWDDTIYGELGAYAPLDPVFAGRLGEGTNSTSDRFDGPMPYGRFALLHDFGTRQTAEIGVIGLTARRYPGGDSSQGADTLRDWAVDGNYQYLGHHSVVSAHAIYIREDQDLAATSILLGTQPRDHVETARADLSYSFNDTWTPSIQAFSTSGSPDPALYPQGPRTTGYVAEAAWVPFGKSGSPLYWVNTRLSLQYVAYTEFNGARAGSSAANTLYLNFWVALAPFGAFVKH
jgi:hypothetical protein